MPPSPKGREILRKDDNLQQHTTSARLQAWSQTSVGNAATELTNASQGEHSVKTSATVGHLNPAPPVRTMPFVTKEAIRHLDVNRARRRPAQHESTKIPIRDVATESIPEPTPQGCVTIKMPAHDQLSQLNDTANASGGATSGYRSPELETGVPYTERLTGAQSTEVANPEQSANQDLPALVGQPGEITHSDVITTSKFVDDFRPKMLSHIPRRSARTATKTSTLMNDLPTGTVQSEISRRNSSQEGASAIYNHSLNESDEEVSQKEPVPNPQASSENADAIHNQPPRPRRVAFRVPEVSQTIPYRSTTSAASPSGTEDDTAPTYLGDYVVESIVDHGYADDGGLLVRIRWYGYTDADDTWQPCSDVPRSHLLRYFKRQRLPLPKQVQEAQTG